MFSNTPMRGDAVEGGEVSAELDAEHFSFAHLGAGIRNAATQFASTFCSVMAKSSISSISSKTTAISSSRSASV
jgi:hypothetical protein